MFSAAEALDVLGAASSADGFTQTGGTISAGYGRDHRPWNAHRRRVGRGDTAFTISGQIALANYTFAGASVLTNKAVTNQTGGITVGDQTGINATINNTASGTYKIAGDFGIAGGAQSAKFVNAGLLDKTDGSATSFVGIDINNTGTLEADSGLLQFNGPANTIGGKVIGCGRNRIRQQQRHPVLFGNDRHGRCAGCVRLRHVECEDRSFLTTAISTTVPAEHRRSTSEPAHWRWGRIPSAR